MIISGAASYESFSNQEWIVTNGIGGYASGSVAGANTRRYHGLLVASYNPPTDRRVLVSKMEETISYNGERFPISSNQYPGAIFPEGYKLIKSFDRAPFPKWIYQSGELSIEKTVFMVYGRNIAVVEYKNAGSALFQLELVPLLVYRDYHHLMNADDFNFSIEQNSDHVLCIQHSQDKPYYIFFEKGIFVSDHDRYKNFEYQKEKERGLDYHEDAFSPGKINVSLYPGERMFVILSADEQLPDGDPSFWKKHEELRLSALASGVNNTFLRDLIISGDQFLVWRLSSKSHTLIAGYHWFTDWGRDTMIAMRGLIIETGKRQLAESVFLTFLQYLDHGMIPNRFPDQGEKPEYNTIDATLWMFVAIYEYFQKFGQTEFIERIFPSLTEIMDAHFEGTRYHIHVTLEGLLFGGEENVQLTWMDAKVNNHVVTPRQGCAVEINALWYNALQIYMYFGALLNKDLPGIEGKVKKTGEAFNKYFINEKGYLNDVVVPGTFIDDAIRPNQIFAVSLPFSPLEPSVAEKVLQTVEDHLYTDFGLCSLSPQHPEFKPFYKGDQWERDHAYHQGTVWSYLWGEYALAYLKVNQFSDEAKKVISEKLSRLRHHFYHENGIHAISEIFDGGKPNAGKGCIQQAWSVGMVIKVLILLENGEL